jgi:hypothetical protein
MRTCVCLATALLLATAALAAEVAGVKLDEKVNIAPNAPELALNGAGVRTRFFIRVYVAGLYLSEKRAAAEDVLGLAGAKRMSLAMLRDVTAQQFAEALNEGFSANNTPADQERYKAQLADLNAIMMALGQVKKGDTIALDYLPEVGMRLRVNGADQGKPIADEGFYRALLKVWLGDKPVDADLKKALLGQGS